MYEWNLRGMKELIRDKMRVVCSCMYSYYYQQMNLKVHCLAYENEYTGKILEKCGIHLTRAIFIYKVCIVIFGTETVSHVESVQMWCRCCTGLVLFCGIRYTMNFKIRI